jgi:hypothetical protein
VGWDGDTHQRQANKLDLQNLHQVFAQQMRHSTWN